MNLAGAGVDSWWQLNPGLAVSIQAFPVIFSMLAIIACIVDQVVPGWSGQNILDGLLNALLADADVDYVDYWDHCYPSSLFLALVS